MIFNQRKVDPETRKLVLDLLRYQLDLGIRNRDSIFERLATLIALLRVLASLVGVIVTADVFPGFARD